MFLASDLFDKRVVIGGKLEQLLIGQGKTKASLCKESGISRPTLDKIIAGTITNKTNYEKHITKIMNCLSITPDILLGNSKNMFSRTKSIRKALKISTEHISLETGISEDRLKDIENGDAATLAELRDIAYILGTSVRCLNGENFFDQQIASLDIICKIKSEDSSEKLSGFWGHIGLLLSGTEEYLWFPITGNVRDLLYKTKGLERITVPCMNNKLLICNMKNVKNILLLDDACDQPSFANWNRDVDEGTIPLALYEALEDYCFYDREELIQGEMISENMLNQIEQYADTYGYSEDDLLRLVNETIIYFNDGQTHNINFDVYCSNELVDEIAFGYDFGDDYDYTKVVSCSEMDGAEFLINMDKVAMIEFPFIELENAICKSRKELFGLE